MFKKKFLKTKCKVTFELPQGIEGAEDVYLVGDFNNWDEHATQMEKKRGNRFTVTVDLEPCTGAQQTWHVRFQPPTVEPGPITAFQVSDHKLVADTLDGGVKA